VSWIEWFYSVWFELSKIKRSVLLILIGKTLPFSNKIWFQKKRENNCYFIKFDTRGFSFVLGMWKCFSIFFSYSTMKLFTKRQDKPLTSLLWSLVNTTSNKTEPFVHFLLLQMNKLFWFRSAFRRCHLFGFLSSFRQHRVEHRVAFFANKRTLMWGVYKTNKPSLLSNA
jgi:hypothetical protein